MKNKRDDKAAPTDVAQTDTQGPMTKDSAIRDLAQQLHRLPAFQRMDVRMLERLLARNRLVSRRK